MDHGCYERLFDGFEGVSSHVETVGSLESCVGKAESESELIRSTGTTEPPSDI